jgi:hypothetical protein
MKLTPSDLKYDYCWHCMANYAICPHCNANSCSCGCSGKYSNSEEKPCEASAFWEATEEAFETGYHTFIPTQEQVEERYNWFLSLTKEKVEKWIFSRLDEEYYYVEKFARKYNIYTITYEELCEKLDIKPQYECQTVDEWMSGKIKVDYDFVKTMFGDSRIPWAEFVDNATKERSELREMR